MSGAPLPADPGSGIRGSGAYLSQLPLAQSRNRFSLQ